MTAARRLAAILAVDFMGYLAPHGRGRGGGRHGGSRTFETRCSRHARSEMLRQESQVTVDGRLRVAAGVGSRSPRGAASESPESPRIDFRSVDYPRAQWR